MEQNLRLMKTVPEIVEEAVGELAKSQHELGNFYKVTMERVFGMLLNEEEFKLHPKVKENLEAIQKLGES